MARSLVPRVLVPLALLPLVMLGSAASCDFDFGPERCPDLEELCPALQCDDYVQNRDGCSICECVGAGPTICFDDSECADGELCDTVNFCEQAPGCTEEGPCPSACYGRCVPAPTACASNADCPPGDICSFYGNARTAEPPPGAPEEDAPAPVPAPDGVCVPGECSNLIDLPACPPGTELVVDFTSNPCGVPLCVPLDKCRDLPPDACLGEPGCELVEEPCACDPNGNCDDCVSVSRCVSVDECGFLGADVCLTNPNCELIAVDGTNGGGGGGGSEPICEVCDPNTGECRPCDDEGGGAPPPEPPPTEALVCVPRNTDGTCFVDAECAVGEICLPTTVCASGCVVNSDGSEECFSQCWNERGVCVASPTSCFNLTPEQCASDARCELVATPDGSSVCRPLSAQCDDNGDCQAGQHCETQEACQPCDPSTGTDIGCAAPCFVDGRCVDGPPPPPSCIDELDCGEGFDCLTVDVCSACTGLRPGDGGSGGGDAPAPPCETTCSTERLCIAVDPVCYSDADCGADEFCDLSAFPDCDASNGFVACPGLCEPLARTFCQSDEQCSPEQRCPTELDICGQNPDDPSGGCWWTCVDRPREEGTYCIENVDCADGETCRFHPDVCLDDPNLDAQVCSGWCAGICGAAQTTGLDPETEQCVLFNDTCVPPGWIPNGC